MPSVIFIAGPNGAGKTTFSDEYLSAEERKIEFVNADEMARGLESHGRHRLSDIAAARMMLNRIEDLVQAEADFIVDDHVGNPDIRKEHLGLAQKGLHRVDSLPTPQLG